VRGLETRESIPESVRHEVLWDYADMPADCHYCQSWAVEIDHIMPISRGGTNARDNLRAACWRCNGEKSDMTVSEWEAWRKRRGYCWPPGHWEGCWGPERERARELDPGLDEEMMELYVQEFDNVLDGKFHEFLGHREFDRGRGYAADQVHAGLERDIEWEAREYNRALRKALTDWKART